MIGLRDIMKWLAHGSLWPTSPVSPVNEAGGTHAGFGLIANHQNDINVANASITLNILYAVKFVTPTRGGTLTTASVNFNNTGDNFRLGIYENIDSQRDPYPGALLWESDPIPVAAGQLYARCKLRLKPNRIYWAAIVVEATKSQLQQVPAGGSAHDLGMDETSGTVFNNGVQVNHTYGALPDPFTQDDSSAWSTLAPAFKLGWAS